MIIWSFLSRRFPYNCNIVARYLCKCFIDIKHFNKLKIHVKNINYTQEIKFVISIERVLIINLHSTRTVLIYGSNVAPIESLFKPYCNTLGPPSVQQTATCIPTWPPYRSQNKLVLWSADVQLWSQWQHLRTIFIKEIQHCQETI